LQSFLKEKTRLEAGEKAQEKSWLFLPLLWVIQHTFGNAG
jgi:hypothetical protein